MKTKSSPPQRKDASLLAQIKSRTSNLAPIISPRGQVVLESESPPMTPPSASKIFKNPFQKPIVGDVFGSSHNLDRLMSGLLYRSRIDAQTPTTSSPEDRETSRIGAAPPHLMKTASLSSFESINELDEKELENIEAMNPRQQLAVTIRNWSAKPSNHANIIQEGAVHALVALSSIDDAIIKESCAEAFYNLSSQDSNLKNMLSMGASSGVITLSMQARSSKISKLCALTLCNLSKESDGEASMVKDGALIALMILLGSKGYKLLPVCLQALYNLTCVAEYYKDIERIIKALINIPATSFDHHPNLVRALVNCTRFPRTRMRIIEDGGIAAIMAMVQSIPNRDNQVSFVYNLLVVILRMSETNSCRMEIILRGMFDALNTLLVYCIDDERKLLLVKSVHYLLLGTSLNAQAFDSAVRIVISLAEQTKDEVVLQYVAACCHIFAIDNFRNPILAGRVVDIMPKLLLSLNHLTQYFAVDITGNLLFGNVCADERKLENLVKIFLKLKAETLDEVSMQTVAVIISRLSQETVYASYLEQHDLIQPLLKALIEMLNRKNNPVAVHESFGIALSRITLMAATLSTEIQKDIANELFKMLDGDNIEVLTNAIACARLLGKRNFLKEELTSDVFYSKLSSIITRHKNEQLLVRMCCSVLAVLSFEPSTNKGLSNDAVLTLVLNAATKTDDLTVKELIATAICNLSMASDIAARMVGMGVVNVVASLSGTTSEAVQELCSKCICNLSSFPELHASMIKQKVLQIILMIALVRSVGVRTRLFCARALLNFTTDTNIPSLREVGAIRVFATLSTSFDQATRHVCGKGFLQFTATTIRCDEFIQRRAVITALFALIKSKSSKVKLLVGCTVCNLLANPVSQKAVVLAGGISVLKIISTMDNESIKENIARVIINLANVTSLHSYLSYQPVVQMLMMIMQQTVGYAFDCALCALSRLSQSEIFRGILIDRGSIAVIVNSVLVGNINSISSGTEVCRCLCFLSYVRDRAEVLIKQGHILLALHAIKNSEFCSDEAFKMMVIIVRNVSFDRNISKYIVLQDAIKLVESIFAENEYVRYTARVSAIVAILNIAQEPLLHKQLLEQGLMSIIENIVSSSMDDQQLTNDDILNLARTIEFVSESEPVCASLLMGNLINIIDRMSFGFNDASRQSIANALANIASVKTCRQILVHEKTTDLVLKLSKTNNLETLNKCSLVLGYISDSTIVNTGVVKSMLLLSLKDGTGTSIEDDLVRDNILAKISATQVTHAHVAGSKDGISPTFNLRELFRKRHESTSLYIKSIERELPVVVEMPVIVESPGPLMSTRQGSLLSPSSTLTSPRPTESENQILADGYLNPAYAKKEMATLVGNYSMNEFETISHQMPPEIGGYANLYDLHFDLPILCGGDVVENTLKRHGELTPVPLSGESLGKDLTIHTAASIPRTRQNSIFEYTPVVLSGDSADKAENERGEAVLIKKSNSKKKLARAEGSGTFSKRKGSTSKLSTVVEGSTHANITNVGDSPQSLSKKSLK